MAFSSLPRRRWNASTHESLLQLLETPAEGRQVAALDWDETCTKGDISFALLDDLARRSPERGLRDWYEREAQHDLLTAYKRMAAVLCAGMTREEIADWTCAVFDQCVAAGSIEIVPEVRDLVTVLRERRWEVWVVTGSPTPVVAALAARIGVDTTRVVGMEPVTGEDGRFVEALHEPVTWREGKVQCLHARAGTLPTLAMGDSEGDIRMLESARYAIWIDRGDPQLRRAARTTWWRQECW